MANLITGPSIVEQDLTVVSTVQNHPLGTKGRDNAGNEYVYVSGVASGAAGDAVQISSAGATTRLVTSGAVGPVGVLMAALTASTYGWAQIYGKATGTSVGDTADGGLVNTTSTAGGLDDASTTRVVGAVFVGAHTGAGSVTLQLNYPTVNM